MFIGAPKPANRLFRLRNPYGSVPIIEDRRSRRRIVLIRFLFLGAVLCAAAIFENLGDAAGYIIKGKGLGPYFLAVGAMAIYGALTVIVGRSGWSFTQAFPLGYLFVYFAVGLIFGAVLTGQRPHGFQMIAAALMMLGLIVNLAGNLNLANSEQHAEKVHHSAPSGRNSPD